MKLIILLNKNISWRFSFIIKGVTETVQNEVKGQKGGFFSMLLGTLGASLLGSLLTGIQKYHKNSDKS